MDGAFHTGKRGLFHCTHKYRMYGDIRSASVIVFRNQACTVNMERDMVRMVMMMHAVSVMPVLAPGFRTQSQMTMVVVREYGLHKHHDVCKHT